MIDYDRLIIIFASTIIVYTIVIDLFRSFNTKEWKKGYRFVLIIIRVSILVYILNYIYNVFLNKIL